MIAQKKEGDKTPSRFDKSLYFDFLKHRNQSKQY